MTVVLAIRCVNGIVLASDSQITDPGRGLSYPAQKLHPLGAHAAWGGSGSRAALYDIEQVFNDEADAIIEEKNLGHALQARVLPILKHHYENFISEVPGQEAAGTPRPTSWPPATPVRCRSSWTSTRTGSSHTTRRRVSRPSGAARRWPSRRTRCCPISG